MMENKRKHIRFDNESSSSSSSSSSSEDECNTSTSAINKTRTFFNKIKKINEAHTSIASPPPPLPINTSKNKTLCTTSCLDVILVKNKLKKETSFGFQLRGDELVKGKHYIDNVDNGTAASRVGLRRQDKIIKVNGVCVSNFFISQLIHQIEYETSLNEFKLHLSVQRESSMGNSNSNGEDISNYNNGGVEDEEDDSYYSNNHAIVNSLCMYCKLNYLFYFFS